MHTEEIHIKNIKELNFHPVLKDVEYFFWFFLLSVRTLADYDIQNLLRKKINPKVVTNFLTKYKIYLIVRPVYIWKKMAPELRPSLTLTKK